jgi:hypothetical protein
LPGDSRYGHAAQKGLNVSFDATLIRRQRRGFLRLSSLPQNARRRVRQIQVAQFRHRASSLRLRPRGGGVVAFGYLA